MPVNPSELNLFLELSGKPANIPFKNVTIPTRDAYEMPARIYNSDHDDTKPVLIIYPGCGYVCDSFESNAIAASRIAAYADIKVILAPIIKNFIMENTHVHTS